jgi:hypothetical protein
MIVRSRAGADAGGDVVVDHADTLHKGVADRAADKAEAVPLQVAAERIGD